MVQRLHGAGPNVVAVSHAVSARSQRVYGHEKDTGNMLHPKLMRQTVSAGAGSGPQHISI